MILRRTTPQASIGATGTVRTFVRLAVGPQGAPGGATGGVVDEIQMRADDETVHPVRLVASQGIYTLEVDQSPTT